MLIAGAQPRQELAPEGSTRHVGPDPAKEGDMNWITNIRRGAHLAALVLTLAVFSPRPARAGINRWTSHGPDVAGVSRVAIDPMDSAVVYASTRRGVFKSSDGGASWSDPSSGKLDGINIHSLAIDLLTPSSIYVGTSSGVLKSADGGASWRNRLIAGAIYNLIFGSQKSTIYAADFDDVGYYPAPSSVYKSTDDGETWSRSASGFSIVPGTLVIDPTQPSTVYATSYDYEGVQKSVDAGSTWSMASGDLAGYFVNTLAIDARHPTTLYAGTYRGIFKSVDASSTWHLASSDLNISHWGVSALAIDPRDSNTLYAGTYSRGVFRSTDGGATWGPFNEGLSNLGVTALAIDRTGTLLHAATASGVFSYQATERLDLFGDSNGATGFFSFDPLSGHVLLGSVDSSGRKVLGSPYGPYAGWTPIAGADGPDGVTRVLWNNDDGSAALWLTRPEGVQGSFLYPARPGWAALDVAAGADGSTHILWTSFDGVTLLQTINAFGDIASSLSFGPYTGWSATAIADGPDGLTRLLWNNIDERAGLSLISSDGILTTARYGPVAGWMALDVAVGGDGLTRILRAHADGRMSLWITDDAGEIATYGPIYSAPAGTSARRVSTAEDGSARVLFTDFEGRAVLWFLSPDGVFQTSVDLN